MAVRMEELGGRYRKYGYDLSVGELLAVIEWRLQQHVHEVWHMGRVALLPPFQCPLPVLLHLENLANDSSYKCSSCLKLRDVSLQLFHEGQVWDEVADEEGSSCVEDVVVQLLEVFLLLLVCYASSKVPISRNQTYDSMPRHCENRDEFLQPEVHRVPFVDEHSRHVVGSHPRGPALEVNGIPRFALVQKHPHHVVNLVLPDALMRRMNRGREELRVAHSPHLAPVRPVRRTRQALVRRPGNDFVVESFGSVGECRIVGFEQFLGCCSSAHHEARHLT